MTPRIPCARTLAGLAMVALVAAAGVALTATSAEAKPRFVRVGWEHPDTATRTVVTWNTGGPEATVVDYGETEAFGQTAVGSSFQAPGTLGMVHEVPIEGLKPNTRYYFRAGGDGNWTGTHTFKTGNTDGCEPFTFVAMGDGRSDDSHGPSRKWGAILGEALDWEPAFAVLTGDQVKDGDSIDQWVHFLEETWDRPIEAPLMVSMGNHDDDKVEGDDALYNQIFSLPPNDVSGTEDYYYFTYGDAIFVALSMVSFTGGTSAYQEQADWLDRVLTENPKTWKFVYFHHPIYTGVLGLPGLFELNHPPNEQGQNAALVPVFDKHHVDIVFAGHNHHYQRFEPMCCGEGEDIGQQVPQDEGTVYVITGGAGALTYDVPFISLPDILCASFGTSARCSGKHHYMKIQIDGLDLHAQVWATSEQLLGSDAANIELLDEFFISKPGTPPVCDEPVVEPDPDPEPAPEPVPDAGSSEDASVEADSAEVGPTTDADAGAAVDAVMPGDDAGAGGTGDADAASPGPDSGVPAGPDQGATGGTDSRGGDTAASADPGGTPGGSTTEGCGGCSGRGGPASGWLFGLLAGLWMYRRRR